MKQLLILSGKGGTGKTTVASAFVALSNSKAFADCDVDAPNLHLVVPDLPSPTQTDYSGFEKAVINRDLCTCCGLCQTHCAFDAIQNFAVGPFECEGCGLCAEICPSHAITMQPHSTGSLLLYQENGYVFSTATLKMGSGASGKLVTAVKHQLTEHAKSDIAIIDGSPGIGCPVIASVSGVDFVLVVAEPTVAGLHDMKRILETVRHFGVPCAVCINKYDVSPVTAAKIMGYCDGLSIPILGKIPYDPTVIEAVNRCQSIAQMPDSPASRAIAEIWDNLTNCFLIICIKFFRSDFNMKIAVAAEGKFVTEHFGHCEGFIIFETEGTHISGNQFVPNPGHRPGFLPVFLHDKGVKVIISGGMGQGAIDIFNEKGVEVIVGASGEAHSAVSSYLQGKLKSTGSVCHEHQHADACGK